MNSRVALLEDDDEEDAFENELFASSHNDGRRLDRIVDHPVECDVGGNGHVLAGNKNNNNNHHHHHQNDEVIAYVDDGRWDDDIFVNFGNDFGMDSRSSQNMSSSSSSLQLDIIDPFVNAVEGSSAVNNTVHIIDVDDEDEDDIGSLEYSRASDLSSNLNDDSLAYSAESSGLHSSTLRGTRLADDSLGEF